MPPVTAKVTVIPAKKQRLPLNPETSEVRKLRVAAYHKTARAKNPGLCLCPCEQ